LITVAPLAIFFLAKQEEFEKHLFKMQQTLGHYELFSSIKEEATRMPQT